MATPLKPKSWSVPTKMLALLFLVGNIGSAVAGARQEPVPSGFALLRLVGFQWALAWWVIDDCRRREISTSVDHGGFVFFAWPLVLPFHLFKTRGVRGCVLLPAAVVGLFVVTYLVAI